MVRGIFKEIEGLIALTIFILFLIFYLNVFRTSIFTNSGNEELIRKIKTIDNVYSQLKKEGYIVSFRVYIPKYSKEILCNSIMSDIKRDFCEKVPIFISSNLSFLFNYDGVLNNTYNTIFKKEIGAFLYLNFSEFKCLENDEYILIEVEGPIDSPKILFITTPTIYYWLENSENISVTSEGNINFEYCYFLQNGVCSKENYGNSYGIMIKIDSFSTERAIFNISKSKINMASNINYYNLEKIKYKIIYEPKCYKDLKFLILEKLSFNFSEYSDLRCLSNYMENLKLNYTFKNLSEIYIGLQFYNEYKLNDLNINKTGPACIGYYNFASNEILNIYRTLFSNTFWFLETVKYNISDDISIFDWKSSELNYGFYSKSYFNLTAFTMPNNDRIISDKLILKKENGKDIKYILIFFDDLYYIYLTMSIFRRNIVIYPEKKISYNLDSKVYYYLFNYSDFSLLTAIYFGYSIPKYELLYIDKISYIDLLELENNNITFYLLNKNISMGEKRDKIYSKGYYTNIKINNSLVEDYLIIYTK